LTEKRIVKDYNYELMKQYLLYTAVTIFAIFVGSQITEGMLLVPYWKSMSSADFYSYYQQHGPAISSYYTGLTIISLIIPIVVAVYSKSISVPAFRYALYSSLFAVLYTTSFYIYFKGANNLFYQAAFADTELIKELTTWTYWHCGRALVECLFLVFLILSAIKLQISQVNKQT